MASNTSISRPGRVARLIYILRPSRSQVAFFLVTEVALTVIGAPSWVHLVAGGLLHAVMVGVESRS